jgi:hypothetical protein
VILTFVSAERVLGVNIGTAQVRLANLVRDGSLGEASHSAYRAGMDHLLRVGPLGELPGVSRLARVRALDSVYRHKRHDHSGALRGDRHHRWPVPVLDVDISLSAEHGNVTRLALDGCYRSAPRSSSPISNAATSNENR